MPYALYIFLYLNLQPSSKLCIIVIIIPTLQMRNTDSERSSNLLEFTWLGKSRAGDPIQACPLRAPGGCLKYHLKSFQISACGLD